VLETLRETPEVLYGGVLALLIVLVLTPAVGAVARRIGAVDQHLATPRRAELESRSSRPSSSPQSYAAFPDRPYFVP